MYNRLKVLYLCLSPLWGYLIFIYLKKGLLSSSREGVVGGLVSGSICDAFIAHVFLRTDIRTVTDWSQSIRYLAWNLLYKYTWFRTSSLPYYLIMRNGYTLRRTTLTKTCLSPQYTEKWVNAYMDLSYKITVKHPTGKCIHKWSSKYERFLISLRF